MSWKPPSEEEIATLINSVKTIAIVGVSNKPDRASHQVAKRLIDSGSYEIFLVNPLYEEVLGQKVYKSLEEIPVPIDVVDVFRKVVDLPPVFESAKKIGAKNIWLQLGISDEALASDAKKNGIGVVMDRCLKVDYDLFKTR
jgi:uncharacterized protein